MLNLKVSVGVDVLNSRERLMNLLFFLFFHLLFLHKRCFTLFFRLVAVSQRDTEGRTLVHSFISRKNCTPPLPLSPLSLSFRLNLNDERERGGRFVMND